MPEIIGFEKKLIQFNSDRETQNEIIRKFDSSLSTKANKQTTREIYSYIDREMKSTKLS